MCKWDCLNDINKRKYLVIAGWKNDVSSLARGKGKSDPPFVYDDHHRIRGTIDERECGGVCW